MLNDITNFSEYENKSLQLHSGDVRESKRSHGLKNLFSPADVYEDLAPTDWIVEDLISSGSVNMFFGEAGSKKTWTCMDLMITVSSEVTINGWLGKKVQRRPVLYVDMDNGERRMRKRLKQVMLAHEIEPDQCEFYFQSLQDFDLGKSTSLAELEYTIREKQIGLVIIDSLAAVTQNLDENSTKEMQPIFSKLRKLAEDTKAAILVIHHANKSGGYRGSTSIKAGIDVLVDVISSPNSSAIKLVIEKARDVEQYSMLAIAEFDDKQSKLRKAEPCDEEQQALHRIQMSILKYLNSDSDGTVDNKTQSIANTIAKNSDGHSKTVRSHIYKLKDKGYLKRLNKGGPRVEAEWGLTELAKELLQDSVT